MRSMVWPRHAPASTFHAVSLPSKSRGGTDSGILLLDRHDPYLDPTIGGALGLIAIVVSGQRLRGAEALGRDPRRRHALGSQIICDGLGPVAGKRDVDPVAARRIGVAVH